MEDDPHIKNLERRRADYYKHHEKRLAYFKEKYNPKGKYSRYLVGQQFGRWTVISFAGVEHKHYKRWRCRCTCGTIAEVREGNLVSGVSRSCGCWHLEILKNKGLKNLQL